ncbi:MAG: helix-turn-helix domain-containing protein [Acidimicrobiales bacterium]
MPADGPLLVSVNEAAKLLGISRVSLYEMIRAGEIEHVRSGRRMLLPRSGLTKFIEVNSRSGYPRHEPTDVEQSAALTFGKD